MTGIVVKQTPTVDQLMEWSAESPRLITEFGMGWKYDPWQVHFLWNPAKTIYEKKSRRIGGTLSLMHKVFLKGTTRIDRGYNYTGVSVRQKDAEDQIRIISDLHDDLPPRYKRPRTIDSKTEIEFTHPNGKSARYQAHPNKPTRSKGGDAGLDEFAYSPDDRAIYVGTLPTISLNADDQLFILSNPWTKRGLFYDIDRCADGKYRNYFRYHIPWWLCPRLCTDTVKAALEAPLMSTKERVKRFGTPELIEIFECFPDLETFQVEYELAFLEAANALFSPEFMDELCVVDWGDEPGAELACRVVEGVPSDFDWMWLLANRKGVLYGGLDVGRQRHESDFLIWDIVGDQKFLRMLIRLYQTPYKAQEETLEAGMQKCDILRTCIDQTGIGNELAENLANKHKYRFEGVTFTPQAKDQLATRMYIAATAEKRELYLPNYRSLKLHFISIKKEAGSGGQVRYSVDLNEQQGEKHHADIFWAGCLGLQAANIQIARGAFIIVGRNVLPA